MSEAKAVTAITAELGEFASSLQYENIPERALRILRAGFADTLGVLIAGSKDAAVSLLARVLDPKPGASECFLDGRSIAAPEAAWINGTAAHALDFDDGANRSHPSAVIVAAVLAEAQTINADGRQMATAYAAGYEVLAELAHRDPDQPVKKGWHPTGVFGAIGAAAAIAKLNRLSPKETTRALAIAASQSSGITANFGTMTKPFHAGKAAHSGLLAGRLAAAGFTASEDALEHSQGFLSAISPRGHVDLASPVRAGVDWHILRNGLNVKKYPMCFCAHRCIDAMLELSAEHADIRPGNVRRIVATISQRNAIVLRNHAPRTGLEAKFSMEFAMACALVSHRVTLVELNDEMVLRDDVQQLMRLVRVECVDEELPDSGYAPYDFVVVETLSGTIFRSRDIEHAKGAFEDPLDTAALKTKFVTCLESADRSLDASRLFSAAQAFDVGSSSRDLYTRSFRA
ncbi:2-methylcitrate dehydratase PrpD [Paraburkholderia silvatlantica]|uniref:2-methylcitrate dehydratase PrpD n=1 Tax=Paraburkholderia silvatlantica TaxID=321895 RepID=A0A2V4U4N0_9BURK|nr:MmgE/PrpD family protein [Paraburkholderia silvatlantica]PYE25483.1 2-methylcitrate dehydratase PrpD [Paraburkholderia silvatlantica]